MKKKLLLSILSLTGTIALAQSPAPKSVTLSVGAGVSNTSSVLKEDARIGNGYQIGSNVFIPFLRKGWDGSVKGSGKFALGIIFGGEYNSAKNLTSDIAPTQSTYKLYTGNLDIASTHKGSSHSTGFTGFGGLQADFTFGKITLSPSISGAYFSLTQDGFSQSTQVMVNGTTQTVVLLESPQSTRTGFITRPQLKASYPLTGNLSVYAAGAINIGPNITSNQSQLVPAGGFNAKNTYEPTQLTTGTRADQTVETRYQTIAVNVGFSWSFGSGSNSSRRLRGKVTKPGDGGMRSTSIVPDTPSNLQTTSNDQRTYTAGHKNETSALAEGNPIGGIIVKGGKNPGGSTMTATTNNNGEFELKGLQAGNYKFTVTTPEEPAGKSISEKGVSSTKGRPKNMAFAPGNPIGGIIVKGGKNPGGSTMTITTNDNGEFELKGIKAGDYKFTIIAPEQSAKGHSEKGIK